MIGRAFRLAAYLVAAALLIAGATTAHSEEVEGVRVSVQAWEQAAIGVDYDMSIVPGGRILVDGPLAIGGKALFRIYARTDITSLPGQSFDPAAPATFGRSASFVPGAYRQIGKVTVEAQKITTAIVAECGFATALKGEVLPRFARYCGGGLRFDERTSGAYLSGITAYRDGSWEVRVSGSIPLKGIAKDAISFGGEAILQFAPGVPDVFFIKTAVDIPGLIGKAKTKKP